MIHMLQNMKKFMFSMDNIKQGYYPLPQREKTAQVQVQQVQVQQVQVQQVQVQQAQVQQVQQKEKQVQQEKTTFNNADTRPFTPSQKDKLFWCFYIIIHGYEEYEMNRSTSFSVEKRIKIEAVEKLKTIKTKLKELKLKRTELEDELVHQQMITVKGLYALCLIHDVSITYIYNRKYCELNKTDTTSKRAIIIQNEKREDSLRSTTSASSTTNASSSTTNASSSTTSAVDDAFYKKIQEEYWYIENIQKPLKAVSAYTLKELQDISQRLHIELCITQDSKSKSKSKSKLYQEILQHL